MYPFLLSCYDPCPEGYAVATQNSLPGGYLPIPTITRYRAVREQQNIPLISLCPQVPGHGPGNCWTTISLEAFEELVDPDNARDPPKSSYVLPAPGLSTPAVTGMPPFSMCKAQVRWTGARNHVSQVLVDIGGRMEITIPPSRTVEADLLVPWEGENDEWMGPVPPDFDDPANPGEVTLLRGRALAIGRAVHSTSNRGAISGTFTQSVFLESVDQNVVTIPIPPAARTVQFYRTGTNGVPVYDWIFDPALQGALGNIAVGADTEGHHDVPQNAKLLRITQGAAANQIVTAVFGIAM